jgi:hypothetical protein
MDSANECNECRHHDSDNHDDGKGNECHGNNKYRVKWTRTTKHRIYDDDG